MTEICKYEECTGCGACANICGHAAIIMKPDTYGFLHPEIDQTLCVNCGLCRKVCPNNESPEFYHPISAWASASKNPIEQLSSTSGGIVSVLSRYMIRLNGVVYGCCGVDINHVHHIRITTEDEVSLLKGSKYVQSQIGGVFKNIREDLLNGRQVLFVGTPCQVAGLTEYIPRKLKSRLITVDFVCHGVPSQTMLTQSLKEIIPGSGDNASVKLQFRIKKYRKNIFDRWTYISDSNIHEAPRHSEYKTEYGLFVTQDQKLIIKEPFPESNYVTAFLTALTYRDSCYKCHYARPERVSDITVGDFHFTTDHKKVEGENRLLSKLIINSEHGREFLHDIRDELVCCEISYTSLLNPSGQLVRPMKPSPLREQFLKIYPDEGMACLSKLLREEKKRIRSHILINKIRDAVYKMPYLDRVIKMIK